MGGSLGLAIKRKFPSVEIVGVDKPAVLKRAKKRRAIDKGVSLARGITQRSDLVVLATPLSSMMSILRRVARHCPNASVVTDVGSVKSGVTSLGKKLFPHGNFIGGHPMSGSEVSGIEGAHPLMFENAAWVLTPTARTSRSQLHRLSEFLTGIGARVLHMESGIHDAVASAFSHLPQLAAVALVNVSARKHPFGRGYLRLAAGGFRDMTRIASSSYEVWGDILFSNKHEVRSSLRLYIKELQSYMKFLGRKNLQQHFAASRRLRNSIPKNMKGFLHPLVDLFVFVRDQPGALARLAGSLARARLNISDLELIKVREGSGGTFRLSFASQEMAAKARSILKKKGFELSEEN